MRKVLVLPLIAVLWSAGCAGMTSTQQRVLSGGAIGAAGGALIGAAAGSAAVGAGVGAGAGLIAGYVYDQYQSRKYQCRRYQ